MSRTPKKSLSRGKRIVLSSIIWIGVLVIAGEAALIS